MDIYLSDLIDNKVINKSKEVIGTLKDALISDISKPHPKLQGILVNRGRKKDTVFVPEHDIDAIDKKNIFLSTDVVSLTPFIASDSEILLSNDVYDKQIVDIDDRRLTRVNDLLLEFSQGVLRLKGVDVSMLGIVRRLKIPDLHIFKRNIVDWEDVQFLSTNAPVKFKVQYKNLESLHPVDIARIIFEGPGYKQGSKVLTSLKDPIAADIIEELSPKLQKNLIESLNIQDVADLIDHMTPDKATDLLTTLGPEYTKRILPLISIKDAAIIKALLNYPEYSTGAYMTTDYLAVPSEITLEETLTQIRALDEIPDFAYYIYVLENKLSNKLVGVLSTHIIYGSTLRTRISAVMTKKLMYAHPDDHIKKTIKKMYRYDLSAMPVLSKTEHKLLGIVTFRDAISVYLPKRWKIKMRRVFSAS